MFTIEQTHHRDINIIKLRLDEFSFNGLKSMKYMKKNQINQTKILLLCYKIGIPLTLFYSTFYMVMGWLLHFYGAIAAIIFIIISLYFYKKKVVILSLWIMSLTILFSIFWEVYLTDGLFSPILFSIIPALALSIMLVGRKWLIHLCFFILLFILSLYLLPQEFFNNAIPEHNLKKTYTLLIAMTNVSVISYFIYIFMRNYEQIFIHLTQSKQALRKANKSLNIAVTQANKANSAKTEFLSQMSHELRTPMNAILGFGQLLELDAEQFTEIQQMNIQEIIHSGNHLLYIINNILDLSKLESGKLEVLCGPINIEELLEQCIKTINLRAEKRQIKIFNHVNEQGNIVKADAIRLKQVLLNILSNAVKYNKIKGNITLKSKIIDKQYFKIIITDTGEGINQFDLKKIFHTFERLNKKTNVEGTGIGLAISKYLIELMGGSIGVTSTQGTGSTFWITIPLLQQKDKLG